MVAFFSRTFVFRAIAVGLLVALVGYISALTSRRGCEAAAAARIERELGSRAVFVLPESVDAFSYPGSESILQRNGFRTKRCLRSGDAFDCFPWAGVSRASVFAPFLVKVKWACVGGPLSGYGTRTLYLVLFGAVFELRDGPGWVT